MAVAGCMAARWGCMTIDDFWFASFVFAWSRVRCRAACPGLGLLNLSPSGALGHVARRPLARSKAGLVS
eukprot:6794263-Prymnesium_polylepis.1